MGLTQRDIEQIKANAAGMVESTVELAAAICEIPAPTGDEGPRAECVASLFEARGYHAQIDEAGNVNAYRGDQRGPCLMLLAHTDTVFPHETDLTVVRKGDALAGPSIGDNSLGVAAMLTAIEILDRMAYETGSGIIAVANVGEEGLGNLRGAKAAVERHADRVGAVLAIEGHNLGRLTHVAVGSKRWKVTVRGPGGHSWGAFGQPSAIHGLGQIIAAIADISALSEPRTTYNVGTIEGGTSINTIAAEASALIDMRSVGAAALEDLAEEIGRIIERSAGAGLETTIEVLGERPAGSRPLDDPLVLRAVDVLKWLGIEAVYDASSTDANIPISMNIPSLCIGITTGDRVHTVDEYINVPPIEMGLAQLVRLCIDATDMISNQAG